MSHVERLAPGQVMARVSFDSCLLDTPRRPMPADIGRWSEGLPVPHRLAKAGLARPLREAVAPLWQAWLARFRQGLRIEVDDGIRVVVHCDTVRYRISPRGKVFGFVPRLGGGYEAMPVEVGKPFPSWTWARLIAEREPEALAPLRRSIEVVQLAGLARRAAGTTDLHSQCVTWLQDVMVGLARRCVDGVGMRELLRQALDLDPELMLAARRARPARPAPRDVEADWWNVCVDHAEPLKEMQRVAPGLLPMFGVLMTTKRTSKYRLDLRKLRGLLAGSGLSRADWKRLLRCRARPVWQMHQEGIIRSHQSLWAFLADWACIHRGLPEGMWMPRQMWEPLTRTFVGAEAEHVLPPVRWPGTPAATRQAILQYREARLATRGPDFIEREWGRVVRWAGNYESAGVREPVRHWSTARRLAGQHERKLTAALAGRRWETPLPAFEDGDLCAVAITTGEQLADEAIEMRHCADRFASQCADGSLAIYSIRDRVTGERLATASISVGEEGADLFEVARSLNREPRPAERELAHKLARRVHEALRAPAAVDRDLPSPPPTAVRPFSTGQVDAPS